MSRRLHTGWLLGVSILLTVTTGYAQALELRPPLGTAAKGAAGLWHVRTVSTYPVGHVAVGLMSEFNREAGLFGSDAASSRFVGRLFVSGVVVSGLQIYGGASLTTTTLAHSPPQQTVSVGNPYLGIRYGKAVSRAVLLGGGLEVQVPSAAEGGTPDINGTAFELALSAQFQPISRLTLAVDLGYRHDGIASIFDKKTSLFEAYSADVVPRDEVRMRLGMSYRMGRFEPMLELGAHVPLSAPKDAGELPSWLVLGVRSWPLASRRLFVQLGVELGLTGVGEASGALAPNHSYNILMGLGWVFGGKPRTVVKVREVKVPARIAKPRVCPVVTSQEAVKGGRIEGVVLDDVTGKPVRSARVTLAAGTPTRMTLLTRSPKGDFRSCLFPEGPLKIRVAKQGYQSVERVILVRPEGTKPLTFKLKRATGLSYGVVKGVVHGADAKPVVASVNIPTRSKQVATAKGTGQFQLRLRTGTFDVLISKRGYRTQRHKIHLLPGEEVILNVELSPKK